MYQLVRIYDDNTRQVLFESETELACELVKIARPVTWGEELEIVKINN